MHKKIENNIVVNFYIFSKMSDLPYLKNSMHKILLDNNVKGTVLISVEGINANLCGADNKLMNSIKDIKKLIKIDSIHVNKQPTNIKAFKRLKVKIKKEIIKAGFIINKNNVDKFKSLNPHEWQKTLNDNVLVLDIRNKFEYSLGSFKNAKNLDLLNFSDLNNREKLLSTFDKKKQVAIFCTGGIRCEKAAIVLDKAGFKNIVKLQGGIINYLNSDIKNSKWSGECFVFDDRITI
ncbi:MAG: hypothetical protein CMD65_01990 [Gammaproteobacteria bacterium]|nr:hypothetical protein [Gammaproteobacteria bacterium]|tara:strand:+ start:3251 stop:3955 length:705 start_codon:yes stop_codon:yes gene_type:complete